MNNKEIWADRFEEQFPNVMQIVITDKPGHEDRNIKGKVMDFIRKALSAQQEELAKDVEKKIFKMLNDNDIHIHSDKVEELIKSIRGKEG